MYQHCARLGQGAGGEHPSHAVAILNVQGRSPDIRIVNVNTDYQRLWGGSRETWLGAAPVVVKQQAANQRIFAQLHKALIDSVDGVFEGLSGCEVSRQYDGTRRYLEWRITAMGERTASAMTLVLTQRDVTEQVEKEAQLERLATIDMLTGLFNRSYFDTVLKNELSRHHRYARPLSLIMLDIDYFKEINDANGHDVGDYVLVELAQLLKHNLRKSDCLARWGGEEFILLTPETSLDQAVQLADKMRRAIKHIPFSIQGKVTASFGVVEVNTQESVKSVMKRVDRALYLAKDEGRDRVFWEDPVMSTKPA